MEGCRHEAGQRSSDCVLGHGRAIRHKYIVVGSIQIKTPYFAFTGAIGIANRYLADVDVGLANNYIHWFVDHKPESAVKATADSIDDDEGRRAT